MAFELKEYVGAVALNVKSKDNDISLLSEGYTQTYIDENSLMVDIEGIHSIITRNDTFYAPDCLKESVPYWTSPYERPVIMHHNERDGKIIGRIKSVNYISRSERSGTAALEFVTNIGDEEGKTGIKNGTLATVSIGAIAHDIRCSVCNRNLVKDGLCEHSKGETYDGQRCYWIVKKIEPKELSFVIVPSDIYAHSTRVYPAVNINNKNKNKDVNESMALGTNNIFADLIESTKAAIAEGSPIDEEVKDGEKANPAQKIEDQQQEDKNKDEGEKDQPKDSDKTKEEEQKPDEEDKTKDTGKEDPKKEKTPEQKDEDKSEDKIKELEAEVEKLKAENISLKKSVETEKKLKESAEVELVKVQQERKVDLIERVNKLRTDIGLKAQDVSSLMESSIESLQVSLKTYSECKESNLNTIRQISLIESPISVSNEKDNTIVPSGSTTAAKNLKENVDFKAKLGSIFGID